ncbi:MAG: hypothetical protein Kow00120_13630 [Anaerolineae bacterium]
MLGLAFVREGVDHTIARFEALSWFRDTTSLAPHECVQLVYGLERRPLRPARCDHLLSWRATRDSDHLFWRAAPGEVDAAFRVFQGSKRMAECPVRDGECAVSLPLDPPTVLVGNLILFYTRDRLTIFNDAANTEPPLEGLMLTTAGDPALMLDAVAWEVMFDEWDGAVLGAGQCLVLYQGEAPTDEATMRCQVVAQAGVEDAPWRVPFGVRGSVLGRTGLCPAAREGVSTLCVVPQ